MFKTLTLALAASTLIATSSVNAEPHSNLVTVVTSPNPQTQLMAMVLTMQAAQQGSEAHLLLCGPAGDLALENAPMSATAGQPPRGASPQGLMQMIRTETGATVEVCAIYLPSKGEDQSILLEGITVADPAEMARKLLDTNTRVITF